jgi:DNA-binding IscR family transcriptional regulator
VRFEQIAARLNLPDASVQRLLERLQHKQLICPVESENDNAYLLTRPAEKIGVLEIMDIGPDQSAPDAPAAYQEHIAAKINRVNQQAQTALGDMTLADIIAED